MISGFDDCMDEDNFRIENKPDCARDCDMCFHWLESELPPVLPILLGISAQQLSSVSCVLRRYGT